MKHFAGHDVRKRRLHNAGTALVYGHLGQLVFQGIVFFTKLFDLADPLKTSSRKPDSINTPIRKSTNRCEFASGLIGSKKPNK